MKKFTILFLFLTLFSSIMVSAVEFEMKTNFSQDETFIAKISGNFFEPITATKITFKRENVRVPLISFVTEINDEFYIYSQLLGKPPGNYSINIENVKFFQSGILVEQDLIQNFTITENKSRFTINPGFIVTNKSFSIEILNLKNNKITVTYKIVNESEEEDKGFFASFFGSNKDENETEVEVKSGEIKKINFEPLDFKKFQIEKLKFSAENTSYEIPIYIELNETVSAGNETARIKFEQSELNISIPVNSNTSRIIYLLNSGDIDLNEVIISVSDSLKPYAVISNSTIDLEKNSSARIEINFSSDNDERILEGEIKAESNDTETLIPVYLSFLKSYQGGSQICSDINGIICAEGQKCSGNIEYAKDGTCCIGTCIEVKKSSIGKIVGWILIACVALYLTWFYLTRYKRVRNPVDLLKVAKGR